MPVGALQQNLKLIQNLGYKGYTLLIIWLFLSDCFVEALVIEETTSEPKGYSNYPWRNSNNKELRHVLSFTVGSQKLDIC